MFKIASCKCPHKFQDRRYGRKRRVHNKMKNGNYRCTVCENVRS